MVGVTLQESTERLRRHVYQLAETIGERNVFHPQALHAAEEYLRQRWQEMGYAVRAEAYQVCGVRSANLEVTLPGRDADEGMLLIGAHYDSVRGSPGANDNGSGVACLLELSQLVRHATPRRSLRFVAFTNEEPPFFFTRRQGSRHYARAARRRGDTIRLMVALETMGCYTDIPGSQDYPPLLRYFFPSAGNFIAFVTNLRCRRELRQFTAAFRAGSDFPAQRLAAFSWIPGVAWSDHLSFWRYGYRALMVTDTAFYRYPYYHSAGDTAEKVDCARLAAVTHGLHGALMRLSEQGV
jgi:Zn-dependent M28 family amino/carboxypeptidase